MKNLRAFGRNFRDAYRRPFTTKKAVFNLVGWFIYGCFIAWMMWFNKYVMDSATWFTFTTNVLCLILAITTVYWSVQGLGYRRFVRQFSRQLDPLTKKAMGPEHGIANLRFTYYKPNLWLADCSCGCGAEMLIDGARGGMSIRSDKPFGPHLDAMVDTDADGG